MKKVNTKNFLFRYLPLFLWMGIIFCFSSVPGTGSHYYDWITFLERKGAHVVEYFVLVILFFRFLKTFNISPESRNIWLIIFPLAFAISDEFHQLFVFGREGRLRDILIDLVGILLAWVFIKKFRKK